MENNENHPRELFADFTFVDNYSNTPTSRRHSTSPTLFHSEKFYDRHFEDKIMVNRCSIPLTFTIPFSTMQLYILKVCHDSLLLLPSAHQKQKRKSVMFPLTIQDQNSNKSGDQSIYSGTIHFSPIFDSNSERSLAEDRMINKMTGEKMKTDEYHAYCLINPDRPKRHPSLNKLAEIFLTQLSQKV